jgi:hypothetical protein
MTSKRLSLEETEWKNETRSPAVFSPNWHPLTELTLRAMRASLPVKMEARCRGNFPSSLWGSLRWVNDDPVVLELLTS